VLRANASTTSVRGTAAMSAMPRAIANSASKRLPLVRGACLLIIRRLHPVHQPLRMSVATGCGRGLMFSYEVEWQTDIAVGRHETPTHCRVCRVKLLL
jgi:hypothetical protein